MLCYRPWWREASFCGAFKYKKRLPNRFGYYVVQSYVLKYICMGKINYYSYFLCDAHTAVCILAI